MEGARALVGLGANVGGEAACAARLVLAVERLAALPYVDEVRCSSLWGTAPVGPVQAQAEFVNAAASLALRGPVAPVEILADLLAIEAELGRARDREVPGGPRAIDLDLLAVGGVRLVDEGPPPLVLPHPRLWDRAFVLAPLAELAGVGYVPPGQTRAVGDRLGDAAIAGQPVRRLTPDAPGGAAGGRCFPGDGR